MAGEFFATRAFPPFDGQAIAFLAEVSRRLSRSGPTRRVPELMALAYFLRSGNLSGIVSRFRAGIDDGTQLAARGVVLHIAPSNVDTIFMYSWALALLAGNTSIVRVSQHVSGPMEALLATIAEVLVAPEWRALADRNVVLTYPHDDETSAWVSRRVQVRMIWGGDRTIETIRALPASPTVKDVVFADKFSYTVVNAKAYLDLGEAEAGDIAGGFYNDAYVFGQMACSSPRLVYFVGPVGACEAASTRWWGALEAALGRRGHEDDMPVAMEKLIFLHERVARGPALSPRAPLRSTSPHVLRVAAPDVPACRETCGGGVFFECFLPSLADLAPLVQANDQTLTHVGFAHDALGKFVRDTAGRGIDRVVPVGRALEFSAVWDGYELLSELTRRVIVWGPPP